MVVHEFLLMIVQAQPAGAVTVTLPVPPLAVNEELAWVMPAIQGGCVSP